MIRAEDEDSPSRHHRSPDSDYYADLMNRVDSAVGKEEDDEDDYDDQPQKLKSGIASIGMWLCRNIKSMFSGCFDASRVPI